MPCAGYQYQHTFRRKRRHNNKITVNYNFRYVCYIINLNDSKLHALLLEFLAFKCLFIFINGIVTHILTWNDTLCHFFGHFPLWDWWEGWWVMQWCHTGEVSSPTDVIDSQSNRVGMSVRASNLQDLTRSKVSYLAQQLSCKSDATCVPAWAQPFPSNSLTLWIRDKWLPIIKQAFHCVRGWNEDFRKLRRTWIELPDVWSQNTGHAICGGRTRLSLSLSLSLWKQNSKVVRRN
jgi:hypothetical protein